MARAVGAEATRLREAAEGHKRWNCWGPYLSERQWGTVREDYSRDGTAWDYFPHDHARSRPTAGARTASAGICDDQQRLCLALALWNGRDPILKERLFGLTNGEGNHGEDVKEFYYYLDATPTHSYLKMLYKYPQAEFPYARAGRGESPARQRRAASSSCSTPGVFDDDRYFDVFVEYAKAGADDIAHAHHASTTAARSRPTITCCRSSGSATPGRGSRARSPAAASSIAAADDAQSSPSSTDDLGARSLYGERRRPSCCSPTTRPTAERSSASTTSRGLRQGRLSRLRRQRRRDAVNPRGAAPRPRPTTGSTVPAGGQATVRLRLVGRRRHRAALRRRSTPIVDQRQAEADEFYADLQRDARRPGRCGSFSGRRSPA